MSASTHACLILPHLLSVARMISCFSFCPDVSMSHYLIARVRVFHVFHFSRQRDQPNDRKRPNNDNSKQRRQDRKPHNALPDTHQSCAQEITPTLWLLFAFVVDEHGTSPQN